MTEFIVRRAVASDNPEWLRMRKNLWPDEVEEGLSFREMNAILLNPMMPVFVAERTNGLLCGFLEAGTRQYEDGGEHSGLVGYVEGWFVDLDSRENGVGLALLNATEEWAAANGLKEIGSDTWLNNDFGSTVHKKLGFSEVERLVHFFKRI